MRPSARLNTLLRVLSPSLAAMVAAAVALAITAAPAAAAPFTPGNLVVYRVGTGSGALTSAAAAAFLDEYTPSGALVQTIALPTAISGPNRALTAAGSATSEGQLSRSADGLFLVVAGYDAAPGTAGVATTAPGTVNRVVARIDVSGSVDTTTALNDAAGNARGAASSDGNALWISSSSGGVRYTTLGSATTSTPLSSSQTNTRVVRIFRGYGGFPTPQLYVSSASGAFQGVATVGTGLPTSTGQTTTLLPGFPTATGPSAYAFVFYDLDSGVAGPDTVYVADDRPLGTGGGLQKWTYDGTTWTLVRTYTSGLTAGLRGLTGTVDGTGQPVLYVTSAESSIRLLSLTDSGPTSAFASLATAATNTAFRGVALAPESGGGGDVAPSVASTNPTDGAQGVPVSANIGITFSEPVTVAGTWFDITCSISGPHAATVSGGPTTFTLDADTNFAAPETCMVTVVAAQVTDQDATDPPDAMAADHVFDFDTLAICGDPAVSIHDVQGSGAASPRVGQAVTIEGVVVGDFQGSAGLNGFFVQEENGKEDGDLATSEGIFVFDGSSGAPVAAGDLVRVSGTVTEFNGLTEIATVTRVEVCSTGNPVTATSVSLPFASSTEAERYEGMLVVLSQTLSVTEVFNLGRFGEVLLSSGGRLLNPTDVVAPGAPAVAMQAANNLNNILMDDNSNAQNVDPTPFMFDDPATPAVDPTLRVDHTVTGLTGVMNFGFGAYRVQPVAAPAFVAANPRPTARPAVGGRVKVAASNVLNYFNGDGYGGGFPTSRGANTAAEFARQRDKIIASLLLLDADVTAVMEIENDSTSTENAAIEDLVDGLNAWAGAGTYAFIDTGIIGSDAIRVALLYKPATVAPVGTTAVLLTGTFNGLSRPPIAQAFAETAAAGETFIVVANHFKSKSCGGGTALDLDQGDGQSCYNGTRVQSANELMAWLATDPTGTGDPDIAIVGDLNSYTQEDPITALEGGGYTNGVEQWIGPGAYSFVFTGQSGTLDHALFSSSLAGAVMGVAQLHSSADEPRVLDYNMEFKSPLQQTLEVGTPYRAADHDAVLIGLFLSDLIFEDGFE